MRERRAELVQDMDCREICDRLPLAIISREDKEEIDALPGHVAKNRQLLDIISRKGQDACKALLHIHDEIKQRITEASERACSETWPISIPGPCKIQHLKCDVNVSHSFLSVFSHVSSENRAREKF